jgi:hypothetical protein
MHEAGFSFREITPRLNRSHSGVLRAWSLWSKEDTVDQEVDVLEERTNKPEDRSLR